MKVLFKKLEDLFAAATFAEAGEFETAREILREDGRPQTDRTRPTGRPGTGLRAPGLGR